MTRIISRLKKERAGVIKTNLPIAGNIRIGEKSVKSVPRSLDYFVASGQYESAFNKAFPEKPNCLQVAFSSNDMSECVSEVIEFRHVETGELWAFGDGETWHCYSKSDREYVLGRKGYEEMKAHYVKQRCVESRVLRMFFVILKMPGIMGVWKFETRAVKSSIPEILRTVDTVYEESGGRLVGLPFDLSVKKHTSNSPGEFKRVYPVVKLMPNISPENMAKLAGFREELNNNFEILSDARIEQIEGERTAKRLKA